jgi:hypothetical protein
VIVPEPNDISFTASEMHEIYGITNPLWTRVSNPNSPASLTQNNSFIMLTHFWASSNLTYPTAVYVDVNGTGGRTFYEDSGVTFSTSWASTSGGSTSMNISEIPEPNSIGTSNFNLTWYYKVPSGTITWIPMASASGPHKIYRVFGENTCPDVNYTAINIKKAVEKVGSGKSTEAEIASSANDNVYGVCKTGCMCKTDPSDPNNPYCQDLGFQANFDAAMGVLPSTPPKGMCCCRAEGLDCVLNVLGIGPYTHDYVNECAEPNPSGSVYYHDCPTCGVRVFRGYWDSWWNVWEGVVKAGGTGSKCYAPANGAISIDEGTYAQIRSKIISDCGGFHWYNGPLDTDICTHYGAP